VIVVGILAPDAATVGSIARRAAGRDVRVELVGVAAPGPAGDRLLLGFSAAGVGHATVTRSDAPGVEPADLELALRYLPDVRAIVIVAPDAILVRVAAAGAAWSGAALVVVGPVGDDAAAAAGVASAVVLEAPQHDPDEAFAGLVAEFARRVDAGESVDRAWRSTLAALAVDRA
jgi:hypothetical protein